jgi:hypothetical protein
MTKWGWVLATGIVVALGPGEARAQDWETRLYRTWLPVVDATAAAAAPCPEVPADPTPEAIRAFLRESHRWVESMLPPGTLTPGVLCAYDPETATLVARVIPGSGTDGLLRGLPESCLQKFLAHDLVLFEGAADRMRGWMEGLGAVLDHRPAVDQLEAWVSSGEAGRVAVTRIESRSGERAEVVSRGSLTLEATLGPDGTEIDSSLAFEWPGASGTVKLVAAITGTSGEPRVIGAWNPDGDRDRLQVAVWFPSVAVVPDPNEALARWIEAEGDAVAPPPSPVGSAALPPPPAGMAVRTFRVPPSFLRPVTVSGGDPFADLGPAEPPPRGPAKTPQAVLEEIGVTFPEGAYAQYDEITSRLVVCNTGPNLDLTEAFVGFGGCDGFSLLTATIHVVEAPAARILAGSRQTAGRSDHGPVWNALSREPDTRILATILVPGRSGDRVKFEAGPAPEEGVPSAGTSLELCPTIGPDGSTVDIQVSLRHEGAKLSTAAVIRSGTTRLLGIWKPGDTPPDLHRAAFLRVDLVRDPDE